MAFSEFGTVEQALNLPSGAYVFTKQELIKIDWVLIGFGVVRGSKFRSRKAISRFLFHGSVVSLFFKSVEISLVFTVYSPHGFQKTCCECVKKLEAT